MKSTKTKAEQHFFYFSFLLFFKFDVSRNTPTPAKAIKLPNKANHPVDQKRKIQTAIEKITGTGNNHILKGRFLLPNLALNKTTPTACPIN